MKKFRKGDIVKHKLNGKQGRIKQCPSSFNHECADVRFSESFGDGVITIVNVEFLELVKRARKK